MKSVPVITEKTKVFLFTKKIRTMFPDNPAANLMFAVFAQAIKDLYISNQRSSVIRHLKGEIQECEICGIDSDWVRSELKKYQISLDHDFKIS